MARKTQTEVTSEVTSEVTEEVIELSERTKAEMVLGAELTRKAEEMARLARDMADAEVVETEVVETKTEE